MPCRGMYLPRARPGGRAIRDGAAIAEDCHAANLVVSPVPAHSACQGVPIIDRIDTYRQGGHAVWLDAAGITIETVRDWQGERLWSPRHAPAAKSADQTARPTSSE